MEMLSINTAMRDLFYYALAVRRCAPAQRTFLKTNLLGADSLETMCFCFSHSEVLYFRAFLYNVLYFFLSTLLDVRSGFPTGVFDCIIAKMVREKFTYSFSFLRLLHVGCGAGGFLACTVTDRLAWGISGVALMAMATTRQGRVGRHSR